MADIDLTDDDKIEIVEPEEVEKPRGHTSWPTRLLVIFNLLAVLGFGALLYVDLDKRQAWAKAVFLRDLATAALPVDDKDTKLGTNPEAGTQGRHDLDPPLIKQAYQSRGGKLSDKFMYVRENFKVHIRPADLDQEILTKHFSDAGAGTPVSTLQQEIKRLKDKIPGEIDVVAQNVASKVKGKSAAEKQDLLRKILFPLCKEGWQANEVEQKILEPRDDKQDQDFLAAAVKRRLWFDILQPMEVFRPTEKIDAAQIDKAINDKNAVADPKSKKALVSRAAKLDEVSVDDLKQLFMKRCDDTLAGKDWIDERFIRDTAEKRRCVAFLLADVGQVEIPGAERGEEKPQPVKVPAKKAAKAKADPDKAGDAKDEEDKKGADQVEPQVDAKPAPRQRQLAFPTMERRGEAVCGLRDYDQACRGSRHCHGNTREPNSPVDPPRSGRLSVSRQSSGGCGKWSQCDWFHHQVRYGPQTYPRAGGAR